MDQKNTVKGYGAAILFSVLVGFSFLGVKTCVPLASSLQILMHRYNFALLALVILMVLRVAKIDLRGKPKKNLLLTAGFYVGFMVLQVIGLFFATSIEGSIIFAIIPIIAKIIASLFLGEKSTVLQNIFVCLTVAALIVMIIMGSTSVTFNVGGAILLILSSISMAISNVFMRYVRDQYKPIEISAAIIIGGCVIFNLAFLVQGLFNGTLHTYFQPFSHPEFIIATAYLGIGCILLSAQLMSYSLSKMEAVKATIFGNVSTAISIIAGVVVLGEPLLPYHIICTILIIVGVVGLSVSGKKKEETDEI
ncbi:DMT family transporter [Anaerovorax odorimutans]|uniref:DMT family transporter n=1 Tax=Anaerovorax odorimutans TaxID=109327 RepID=A0ABT1RRD4_9FIRM|nr:DMT family transporter [Anaerovorax odorimutans]MCQ4637761.1 DMT family transporter [Anaerovorax odorimutans]